MWQHSGRISSWDIFFNISGTLRQAYKQPTDVLLRGRQGGRRDSAQSPSLPSPSPLTASLAWWLRRPPRERKVPGSNPACVGIFSGSSHTSDLNIGTPVATLPGAWRYRVSTGTGRPSVSILSLGEVERWICNFYLSVAAGKIVWADPSLRYTSMLLGR